MKAESTAGCDKHALEAINDDVVSCSVRNLLASSESESLGVMVCGGCGVLNPMLLDRASLLKAGGKDNRLDAGDVRKGRDCNLFYGAENVSKRSLASELYLQEPYIAVFCEALGTSYGDVAVAIFVPAPLLRRRSPVLREHAERLLAGEAVGSDEFNGTFPSSRRRSATAIESECRVGLNKRMSMNAGLSAASNNTQTERGV